MYKHIFLDFDDTLYDTHGNADEALRELFEHFRLGDHFSSQEQFLTSYWKKNQEVWAQYSLGQISRQKLILDRFLYPLREGGIDDEKFALELNDWFLDRTAQKTGLVEGAKDLLEYLKNSYHLHIISNGFTEVQYRKMKNSGVDHYFEQIILSEDVGVNKPDPRIFDFALEKTGAKREESIMIGDNYDTDITGAIRSGINQLFYNPKADFVPTILPTYEVRTLKEIESIL